MTSTQPRPYAAGDHRHAPRTHLFVIATLCWGEGSTPVHVRNMSGKGAQVEGAVLPTNGSPVVLKRGSLKVGGRVAWAAERKAGLAFESTVNVIDWMARQANARQDQIDEIVSALKSAAEHQEPPVARPISSGNPAMVESELAMLRSDLAQLGNALAADVILVATHPEIQLLDIAQQRIERIMTAFDQIGSRS
jgi:hypothetical protein